MKFDSNAGMIRHRFDGNGLAWGVATVPIDDQDAFETVFRHSVQNFANYSQKCFGPQRDGPGEGAEIGCDTVSEHGKNRHAQRLSRLDCEALRKNTVDTETEISVLLRPPERKNRAITCFRYPSIIIQFRSRTCISFPGSSLQVTSRTNTSVTSEAVQSLAQSGSVCLLFTGSQK